MGRDSTPASPPHRTQDDVDIAPDVARDRVELAVAVDDDDTVGLGGGEAQVALAQPLVELLVAHLETVPAPGVAGTALERGVERQVEYVRSVGSGFSHGEGGHCRHARSVGAVTRALVRGS